MYIGGSFLKGRGCLFNINLKVDLIYFKEERIFERGRSFKHYGINFYLYFISLQKQPFSLRPRCRGRCETDVARNEEKRLFSQAKFL